ncbi:2-phosphosulfolactate phosphatase [Dactylosporangium sp. CA-092794]|uniref:2-phosphosulfolactate phosphatase n=1 Tax=Dactylosporangium sp. CA-092794 TaxID=3239929 RepID=UPI003D8D4D14
MCRPSTPAGRCGGGTRTGSWSARAAGAGRRTSTSATRRWRCRRRGSGGRRLIQATSNGTRGLARHPRAAALLAVSAPNVAATARWIGANHAGAPCALVCTGDTAEDLACARYLAGLLGGAGPSPADLVAGILAGAAEHARGYARLPAPDRVDLSGDIPFCRDVDRSAFAMVGDVGPDGVTLVTVAC